MTTPIKPLSLATLKSTNPIVDTKTGLPQPSFLQTLNNAFANIIVTFNALVNNQNDISALVDQLNDVVNQIVTLNNLVTTQTLQAALANSYTDPTSVLTSMTTSGAATITVSAHTRRYADGSSVAVNGGTLNPATLGVTYYVYYSDPTHAGGAVTYQMSQNAADAAQTGGIHCVGSIAVSTTDTTSPTPGDGAPPPGVPSRPAGGGVIP
jgi:hypothetical protein